MLNFISAHASRERGLEHLIETSVRRKSSCEQVVYKEREPLSLSLDSYTASCQTVKAMMEEENPQTTENSTKRGNTD